MSGVVYPGAYPQYNNAGTSTSVFNDELFQSYWFWILVFIAIAALAIAIGVLVWIGTRKDPALDVRLGIQEALTATMATDTFTTDQDDIYVSKNTVSLALTIPNNSSNSEGRQIYIKNDGTGDINLDTKTLVKFSEGKITNGSTVEAGVYAVFIFVGDNSLLRLQ